MSATILLRTLTVGHDPVVLATNVDLTIAPGHVIGLVGANGAGKTTLLRMIAGLSLVSTGSITFAPPNALVGYLPQEVQAGSESGNDETLRDFVGRRTGVHEAEAAMNTAADELAQGINGADDRYTTTLDRWLSLGGADFDSRVESAMSDVGLRVDSNRLVSELSGGQRPPVRPSPPAAGEACRIRAR